MLWSYYFVFPNSYPESLHLCAHPATPPSPSSFNEREKSKQTNMWYINTVKYYSAIKNHGNMIFSGKWIEQQQQIIPEWGNSDPQR